MKKLFLPILLFSLVPACFCGAQGTFIYDQQSSDEFNVLAGGVAINPVAQPAQSFTPSLAGVGFIRLFIRDNDPQDLVGTTLLVNLRSNSFDGPVLASTTPVPILNGHGGSVNFFFTSTVGVTPGLPYYFDIIRQGGNDSWTANISFYNYGGGSLYLLGSPDSSGRDMWFRSGLYVPEPSSTALGILGATCLAWTRRRRILTT